MVKTNFKYVDLRFIWGARREPVDHCARKIWSLIKTIQHEYPMFNKWHKEDGNIQCPTYVKKSNLEKLLLDGRNFTDIGHEVIEDLGFRIWIGSVDEQFGYCQIDLTCGAWTDEFCNLLIVQVWASDDNVLQHMVIERLLRVFESAAAIFEPDFGSISTFELRELITTETDRGESGWVTFISKKLAPVLPALPKGAAAHPLSNIGNIVVAVDHSFPKVPPDNLTTINQIAKILVPLMNDAAKSDS